MMPAWRKDKIFSVLGLLLSLTLLSWFLRYSAGWESKIFGALLLLLAFVKVQIIISQYMELSKAIAPIRVAFWIWTVGVCVLLIGMYWR